MVVKEENILKKIKEQFSLTNKFFYWSLFIILTTILTGINNYYFYAHIKSATDRNNQLLEDILRNYEEISKDTEISQDFINNIKLISQAFLKKPSYTNSLIIKTEEAIIFEKPGNNYPKVIDSNIEIILSNNQNTIKEYKANVNFNKWNLYHPIVNSMTFSILDIFDKINDNETTILKLKQFITKTVIPRSQPTIGFAILIYFVLFLSKKRTYKLEELREKEDLKIKETFQEDLKNNIEIKNTTIIKDKITKYDFILNPPINTLIFEDLFDKDLDTIGTKFRKIAEKIIFKVYEEQIGEKPLRMSLSTAVYKLHKKGILSDTAKNYISIVRVYGNISSHYSDSVICKEEAIAIASSLLNVIDEIYEKNLLENSKLI